MAELIPTSTEAEWLEARRHGVTASEIAIVMGISPYSSPYRLYHEKLGLLPPREQTEEEEVGHVLEPYIAGKFAARHPELEVLGTGRDLYAHSKRPWQMATPDRQAAEIIETDSCTCGTGPMGYYGMHERHCGLELAGPVAVVECKSDNGDGFGEEGTDEVPAHYRAQAIYQMDVMGVARAYVPCLGRDRRVREYLIEHHPSHVDRLEAATPDYEHDCDVCQDIIAMRDAARDFLDRIDLGDVPDVDWHPATASAIRALYVGEDGGDVLVRPSLAISYNAAVRHHKAAEQRMNEMSARLLLAIGNDRRAVDPRTGQPIATRSVSHPRKVSTTLVRERYPEIAAECTPDPRPVVKLTPAKQKTKKES